MFRTMLLKCLWFSIPLCTLPQQRKIKSRNLFRIRIMGIFCARSVSRKVTLHYDAGIGSVLPVKQMTVLNLSLQSKCFKQILVTGFLILAHLHTWLVIQVISLQNLLIWAMIVLWLGMETYLIYQKLELGTMKINTDQGTITLNNDLYVLALHKNLLSIIQFTKENDCNFEFSSTGFVIGHRGTRRMEATRSRHGSLYDL